MQPVPQDLLKEYVQSQHFTSTTEIMEAMKEMFRDVIQTVMEVEMDEELGRERCERSDEPEGTPRNYRNGYTKKTVKTQLGEVDIKVPRDRNGSFEPKIIGKYDRNADGMEDKILALYACIIQAEYGFSDEETALQIQENPYLQYFCGYPGYDDEKLPFDPSLMVYFRKRLTPEVLGEINEMIIQDAKERQEKEAKSRDDDDDSGNHPGTGRNIIWFLHSRIDPVQGFTRLFLYQNGGDTT